MTLVLIVDDVPAMAQQYAYDLKRLGGHETLAARSGEEALEILSREPVDCVILDLEMPGMDGFEVLRAMERSAIKVPVIVYTGTGNFDRCIQAVRLGAHGFIDKAEPMERVVQEIAQALARRRLEQQVVELRRDLGQDTALLGSSPAMQKLRDLIARVAPIPSPILIVGESGDAPPARGRSEGAAVPRGLVLPAQRPRAAGAAAARAALGRARARGASTCRHLRALRRPRQALWVQRGRGADGLRLGP